MFRTFILASALVLFAGTAMAQKAIDPSQKQKASPAASKSTAQFVKNATVGSKFAVDSSRLAAQKAQNPELKTFAQHLADDYAKKSGELMQMVQKAGMPAADPILDARRAAIMRKLQAAPTGAKFDRAYIDAQTTAHNQAVSMFRRYSRNGDNPELKQFAAANLADIQENQKQIKSLRNVKTSRMEKKS
jgi:putative membrane protein